jgi:Flp pilus assembly protein TadD
MFQDAVAEFEKARTLSNENQVAIAELAHAYASSGERAEARRLLKQLEDLSKRSYILPEEIAAVYAGLGENDRALDSLERAVADVAPRFAWIAKRDQRFDSLRANPRFKTLLKKMGLPQ